MNGALWGVGNEAGGPCEGVWEWTPPIHTMLLADVIFGAGLQSSSLRA